MQNNRTEIVHGLAAFSHDFAQPSQYPVVAARDLGRLARLAKAVTDDIAGWGERVKALDCARPFDPPRAVVLVMESLFDEVLPPDACRVLSAEMALLTSLNVSA